MAAGDYLYRFVFEDFGVRGEFVRLAASWNAVQERHDYPAHVETELGKALAAVSLLSGTIKFKGSLIMQTQGDGPVNALVAQATEQRAIRGMAHFDETREPIEGESALGNGRLVLTAESPAGERYQGIVGLEGDGIEHALEGYFQQSEQLATRLWLSADSESAAGLFLQKMPTDHAEDDDWERVVMLADTIKDEELLALDVKEILHRLFHEESVRLFDPEPVAFRCGCSRERIETVLINMGQKDVESIIEEKGAVEADCEFCNARYVFDAVDVAALFNEVPTVDPGTTTQ